MKIQHTIYFLVFLTTACGTKNQATLKTSTGSNPSPEMISQFEKSFARHYEARQCYDNTRRFLKEATQQSEHTWYLLSVENKGFTTFGMINAELARNGRGSPGESNWYHHVFALDENGFVYDLDFTNHPKVLPLKTYLEEMFLNEAECKTPKAGEICAGRERKMSDYVFSLQRAEFPLRGADDPKKKSMSMKELLETPSFKELIPRVNRAVPQSPSGEKSKNEETG